MNEFHSSAVNISTSSSQAAFTCVFPSEENIEISLRKFSEGLIVGELNGEIVAHINSGSTNQEDITDEEFKGLSNLSDPNNF